MEKYVREGDVPVVLMEDPLADVSLLRTPGQRILYSSAVCVRVKGDLSLGPTSGGALTQTLHHQQGRSAR